MTVFLARSSLAPFMKSRALQVLGHQVRSNIHRPREQLAMPSQAELEFDAEAAAAAGDDEGAWLLPVWLSMLVLQSLRMITSISHYAQQTALVVCGATFVFILQCCLCCIRRDGRAEEPFLLAAVDHAARRAARL
jgi:hypothetical protein